MANITTFDSKDLIVTVNNVNITGLGEDGASGEKDEAFFSTSYGVQGDCVVSVTNNDLGTVTITVQKTSPQYAICSAWLREERSFRFGAETVIQAKYLAVRRRLLKLSSVRERHGAC